MMPVASGRGKWSRRTVLPVEERIYVGDFEIFRRHNRSGLQLARETLHIVDDELCIALVETKTCDDGATITYPTSSPRYQLGNHLDSADLELDVNREVISYEEYHPYGTTAYQAVRVRRRCES